MQPAFADLPVELKTLLDQNNLAESAVSTVLVQDVPTATPIAQLNPNTPRNPASTIKLLTTIVALDTFGAGYQWQTKYYLLGQYRDGVLEGDLLIQGGGDPMLSIARFRQQLVALRELGLKKITGDLIIDDSAFDLSDNQTTQFGKYPTSMVDVQPHALLIENNATRFVIQPKEDGVDVLVDPPVNNVIIDNQLVLATGRCQGRTRGWDVGIVQKNNQAHMQFTGTYFAQCAPYSFKRSVLDPSQYIHGLFYYLWVQLGGQFNGRVSFKTYEGEQRPFYIGRSQSLFQVIIKTNKTSNNTTAKQLLLNIANHYSGNGATTKDGIEAMHQWLQKNKLSMPALVIENGSGLSRKPRITANSMAKLLAHIQTNPYYPEFLSALPLFGQDGTLKNRYVRSNYQGRARLKTGSLNGVSTLAGYIRGGTGKKYIFVLLLQNKNLTTDQAYRIQNGFVEWVLKNG